VSGPEEPEVADRHGADIIDLKDSLPAAPDSTIASGLRINGREESTSLLSRYAPINTKYLISD
jgi:hypothetical protein